MPFMDKGDNMRNLLIVTVVFWLIVTISIFILHLPINPHFVAGGIVVILLLLFCDIIDYIFSKRKHNHDFHA